MPPQKKKKNSRTQEKRSSFFCPSHHLLLPLAALLARSNLSLSLAAVNPTTNSPVAGCSRLLRASISCGRVVARLLPNDPSPPPLPLIGVVIHHRRRSSAADVPRRRRAERWVLPRVVWTRRVAVDLPRRRNLLRFFLDLSIPLLPSRPQLLSALRIVFRGIAGLAVERIQFFSTAESPHGREEFRRRWSTRG